MITPENWARVRMLFQEATERPAAERAAFLQARCDDDEAIRREVESLLEAHARAEGFLETPVVTAASQPSSALAVSRLAPGQVAGAFEILEILGTGGMGEVYRARDMRLNRDVAIKVLPLAFTRDPDRIARFERESRVLAALKHPHIGGIHSVEDIAGVPALVLELVEGRTLADRLASAPLPLREALSLARDLCKALEAAHERGIIHRDLKPANVKITPAGVVTLLDFGLAKESVGLEDQAATARAPNADRMATRHGLILGTGAYMSPEQARGKPVDARTDIWALGAILYEMLTGAAAFSGETLSDTLAAVLEREPDWGALPPPTPPGVLKLLRRCLEKDASRRFHNIADVRLEIEDLLGSPGAPVAPRRRVAVPYAIALVSVLAIGSWLGGLGRRSEEPPPSRVTRFTWSLPSHIGLASAPIVSPGGDAMAFVGVAASVPRLFVWRREAVAATPITGTDGASHPFWSPDGQALGFFADRTLKRVAVAGGAPVKICDVADARGGTWSPTGTIVFAPDLIGSGLARVQAAGGAVAPVTQLDASQEENSHRWPAFLPDGIHFLYFVRSSRDNRRGVYLGRADRPASTPTTPLFQAESGVVYAPLTRDIGLLLYTANGRIEGRRFDVARLQLVGDPGALDVVAAAQTPYQPSMFGASADLLASVPVRVSYGSRLTSVGRNGEGLRTWPERESQNWPRLSPDGERLVRQRVDPFRGSLELWVEDLVRGTRALVPTGAKPGLLPVWSPDGRQLAYMTGRRTAQHLVVTDAAGTSVDTSLPCPRASCEPTDWTPDGQRLIVNVPAERPQDVWAVSTTPHGPSEPLLTASFTERDARVSPDGRWIAYVSEESGVPQISIRSLTGAWRRMVGAGNQPVWSRASEELFFVDAEGRLQSVSVRRASDGQLLLGLPVKLNVPLIGKGHWGTQYDVSSDGRLVYFLDRSPEPLPRDISIVLGWRSLLK